MGGYGHRSRGSSPVREAFGCRKAQMTVPLSSREDLVRFGTRAHGWPRSWSRTFSDLAAERVQPQKIGCKRYAGRMLLAAMTYHRIVPITALVLVVLLSASMVAQGRGQGRGAPP